ncbi:MAG: DUF4082 domain-containing protein [Pseudobdellovibrionaceae bacterium]
MANQRVSQSFRLLVLAAGAVALLACSDKKDGDKKASASDSDAAAQMKSAASSSSSSAAFESALENTIPANPAALFDPLAVELGVQLIPHSNGMIHGIRFYQATGGNENYRVSLWDSNGSLLASAVVKPSQEVPGWVTAEIRPPVKVIAGEIYTASYNAPHGSYPYEYEGLVKPISAKNFSLLKSVYDYGNGSSLPQSTYRDTNYFVDVVFKRTGP